MTTLASQHRPTAPSLEWPGADHPISPTAANMALFTAACEIVDDEPRLGDALALLVARETCREMDVARCAVRVRLADQTYVPEGWAIEPRPADDVSWRRLDTENIATLCRALPVQSPLRTVHMPGGRRALSMAVRYPMEGAALELLVRAHALVLDRQRDSDTVALATVDDLAPVLQGDVGDRTVCSEVALLRGTTMIGVWPRCYPATERHPSLEVVTDDPGVAMAVAVVAAALARVSLHSPVWRDRVIATAVPTVVGVRLRAR